MVNPDIDALVAVHVMGWHSVGGAGWYDNSGRCVSNMARFWPSRRIDEAWEVVEHFMRSGTDFHLSATFKGCVNERWRAGQTPIHNGDGVFAEAETAPMAICLAALKTMGIEVQT